MIACLYEDRPEHLIGLKLTIVTLSQHCPDLPLIVVCPEPPGTFRSWVRQFAHVEFRDELDVGTRGWDVKPALLLKLLAEGHQDVVWLDADLLVTAPLPEVLRQADDTTCVVAEEPHQAHRIGPDRASLWGLTPGRRLSFAVNSCVVRVTPRHLELLQDWKSLLDAPAYRSAQAQPWYVRPLHLMGDQEALAALLWSSKFAEVPLAVLRSGKDIAQCHGPSGYSPTDRLRAIVHRTGPPPLVHAQGEKPWTDYVDYSLGASRKDQARRYSARLHKELSPYTALARRYCRDVDEDESWTVPTTRVGRAMSLVSRNHPVAQEFPLALLHAAGRSMSGLIRT